MAKSFQLNIPEPCQEDWGGMKSTGCGRFCDSCKKTVVDLTVMDDQQLALFFKKNTDDVCGRARKDQLSRDLSAPSKPIPWLRHLLKVVIPAMLFSSKAYTQGTVRRIIPDTSQAPVDALKKNIVMGDTTVGRVIKGRVFDTNGNPINGASVMLAGKQTGTLTDKDGSFTLRAFATGNNVLLDVSSFGHESGLFSYPADESDMDVMITLQSYEMLVMGLIAVEKTPASGIDEKKADFPRCATADEAMFKVYPNPVLSGTSINIELAGLDKEDYYELRLISFNGKTIFENKIWIDKGARVMNVSIPSVAAGTYFAVLRNRRLKKEHAQQILITK